MKILDGHMKDSMERSVYKVAGDKDQNLKLHHHQLFCKANICVVSGVKILDGPMTDSMEGSAFTKNFQINDVYSCRYYCFKHSLYCKSLKFLDTQNVC